MGFKARKNFQKQKGAKRKPKKLIRNGGFFWYPLHLCRVLKKMKVKFSVICISPPTNQTNFPFVPPNFCKKKFKNLWSSVGLKRSGSSENATLNVFSSHLHKLRKCIFVVLNFAKSIFLKTCKRQLFGKNVKKLRFRKI